jgi:hypothetical protein
MIVIFRGREGGRGEGGWVKGEGEGREGGGALEEGINGPSIPFLNDSSVKTESPTYLLN